MHTLSGTIWTVVEALAFDADGREVPSPIGRHPMGVTIFEEDRMLGSVTERPSSGTAARVLISYTGPYRFDGAELVTSADLASRPDLVTEQIRSVRFESPTRMVVSPKNDVLGGQSPAGLSLIWERVR